MLRQMKPDQPDVLHLRTNVWCARTLIHIKAHTHTKACIHTNVWFARSLIHPPPDTTRATRMARAGLEALQDASAHEERVQDGDEEGDLPRPARRRIIGALQACHCHAAEGGTRWKCQEGQDDAGCSQYASAVHRKQARVLARAPTPLPAASGSCAV